MWHWVSNCNLPGLNRPPVLVFDLLHWLNVKWSNTLSHASALRICEQCNMLIFFLLGPIATAKNSKNQTWKSIPADLHICEAQSGCWHSAAAPAAFTRITWPPLSRWSCIILLKLSLSDSINQIIPARCNFTFHTVLSIWFQLYLCLFVFYYSNFRWGGGDSPHTSELPCCCTSV